VLFHGLTPKGRRFLITEFCPGGSLNSSSKFRDPAKGLRFFQQIVAGVAHAHSHLPPIYHLDLKPENILLKGEKPVVGDFGICFIDDNELAMTSDGPRGSMYYCAPELRGPRIVAASAAATADVYSLGKILYWLFTQDVYDGHDEDYADAGDRKLARLFPEQSQFAFVDEIIARTVRRDPSKRIATAIERESAVARVAERIEAGGRVLDLRTKQRCLYCAVGYYRPAHEQIHISGLPTGPAFPFIETRGIRRTSRRLTAPISTGL
jgi:serine/threonine protein kinase